MPAKTEAESAIAGLNGKELKGRTLTVNEARPRAEGRDNRDRRGGGDRTGGGRRSSEVGGKGGVGGEGGKKRDEKGGRGGPPPPPPRHTEHSFQEGLRALLNAADRPRHKID